MSRYIFNLNKDIPDDRDYKFSKLMKEKYELPSSIDLRKSYSEIKDQGNLGACTAFSACSVLEYLLNKNTDLSELYFYYKEREADGTIETDSGSSVRQSAKTARKAGTCKEELDPYDISKFAETPTSEADDDAVNHKVKAYYRLLSIDEMLYTLGKMMRPVLIRADIYESFENVGDDGFITIPDIAKEEFLGYHAVNICGYFWTTDSKSTKTNWFLKIYEFIFKKKNNKDKYDGLFFIIRNSWGDNFADKGYMYAPAKFVEDFTGDWWYLEI